MPIDIGLLLGSSVKDAPEYFRIKGAMILRSMKSDSPIFVKSCPPPPLCPARFVSQKQIVGKRESFAHGDNERFLTLS